MESNASRAMVETLARKTLREIKNSPHRSSRNLVDLALHFSKGRFQRHFFELVQTMLKDERSQYFPLVQDIVDHVDHERLLRFGMNVGYNGCTLGAKKIREIEASQGFNIPWTVGLHMNAPVQEERLALYHTNINEGESLGIRVWQIFSRQSAPKLLELAAQHPNSAFVLFTSASEITPQLAEMLESAPNVMPVIPYDDTAEESCRLLRAHQLLYSVCCSYTDGDLRQISCGKLFASTQRLHPVLTILAPAPNCSPATQSKVYQEVVQLRNQQLYQTIPWELEQDSAFVDGIISQDACIAGFAPDGCLYARGGQLPLAEFNLFRDGLTQVLCRAFPKPAMEVGL